MYDNEFEGKSHIVVFDEDSAERLVALVYDLASVVDLIFWNRRRTLTVADPEECRRVYELRGKLRNTRDRDLPF